jgi:hypothetical protein
MEVKHNAWDVRKVKAPEDVPNVLVVIINIVAAFVNQPAPKGI